ncbi:MAG: LapA family protein [Planctomycetota bacterium]
MAKVKLVVAILLCAAVLVVIFQNTEAVETELLFVSVTMPRALLVGSTFLSGIICGLILATRLAKKKSKG